MQQHVTTLHVQGQKPLRWYVELDPLTSKSASVWSRSLHRVLRSVAAVACGHLSVGHESHSAWFVHILVGDVISTNELAAQILLAWVRKCRSYKRVAYFLWAIKRASHQTNLVVSSVVTGRVATVGVASSQEIVRLPIAEGVSALRAIVPPRHLYGAIVRCFK